MEEVKRSYEPGGWHYMNLESFMKTGVTIKSRTDKPDAEFKLTEEFVHDLCNLESPTRKDFKELGSKYGISFGPVIIYYKSLMNIMGNEVVTQKDEKKVKVLLSEYEHLKKCEERVAKYEYAFNQAKLEYDEMKRELAESRVRYGESQAELERLIEENKSLKQIISKRN